MVIQLAPNTIVPARLALPPKVGIIATTKALGTLDPPNRPPLIPDEAVTPAPAFDRQLGAGERWEAGFRFQPENVSGEAVIGPCSDASMSAGENLPIVSVVPFAVIAGDTCHSFGWSAHDYVGRSTRLLQASESKQIAHEFWTGTIAQSDGLPNLYLARTGTHMVNAAAATPANALACLEQGLGDCGTGAAGMIHCTRDTASAWSAALLLQRDPQTGLVTTINGTVVVADAGYPGTSPAGAARSDGHVWAYATSNYVEVRRGAIAVIPGTFSEAMTRDSNKIEWRAERMAAASIDGACVMAAEINLPLCAAAGS